MKKRIVSILLLVTFLLPSAVSAEDNYATREQVLTMILSAADAYDPDLAPSDIMKGDEDGNMRKDEPVRRVEAMAMLSRAFPDLPAPSEYQRSIGTFGVTFSDLPEWAKGDLDNLTRAGILAGYPDGRLGVDDPVTQEQMQLFIRRIWAYLGSNLKDDFYASRNRDWFEATTLAAGQNQAGTFTDANAEVFQQLQSLLEENNRQECKPQTIENNLQIFYRSALDGEEQNQKGAEPLRPYLDQIEQARNLDDLLTAHQEVCNQTGTTNILGLTVDVSLFGKRVYLPYIYGASTVLDKSYFTEDDRVAKQAFLNYVSALLQIGGDEKTEADRQAQALYEMEREINLASLDPSEARKIDQCYRIEETLYVRGILNCPKQLVDPWNKAGQFILCDIGRIKKTVEYLSKENLPVLKSYMKFWLLQDYSSVLGDEFQQPLIDFYQALYGFAPTFDQKEEAVSLTASCLGSALEELYAEKYCSEETKKEVTALTRKLRDQYETLLENSWLSKDTKDAAINKLNSLVILVSHPDEFYQIGERYHLDDDLFENTRRIRSYVYSSNRLAIKQEAPRDQWALYSFEVNAAYDPISNSITVPNGILQAPFYAKDASAEENLAGVGFIIAHEITHAFDDTGAEFNENGRYKDWWTERDRKGFERICNQVTSFYDQWEISNSARSDGSLTLGENMADLGAMSCTLGLMKNQGSRNYRLYFDTFANIWKTYNSKPYTEYLAENDSHSAAKLRVNRLVVNFQEFYDAYGITENDGMYVPPNQRVSMW